MNSNTPLFHAARNTLAGLSLLLATSLAQADALSPQIDDFSDPTLNSLGIDRIFVNDTTSGGATTNQLEFKDGVLSSRGDIVPPRGQPGWSSMVLLLAPDGSSVDLSQYKGISIRLRQTQGLLSVSANSSEVTNFDYHAAIVPYQKGKEFQEMRIPFSDMKRAWSEQTALNTSSIASISLVSVNMQKGPFSYEIDQISFY